ncbi:hypothetical protein E6C70_12070 [Glaciibacter flavus]|uniref:Uncharacterized protein n=1 Tax=Orlajensenia flava TaxID=2565934 RepID=A0A4S4FRJ8_9MICO|nr:hypothetical protein [Glaciibacter flavus]THG32492.1 hypothetical protein E6C70_12070 [Glaciibacter flavus]
MTDGDDAELDPRFDPRFQRGYTPEVPEPGADTDADAPTRRAGERLDPRFDPQFQRGYDPDRHAPTRADRDAAPPVFSSTIKGPASAPPVAPRDERPRAPERPIRPLTTEESRAATPPLADRDRRGGTAGGGERPDDERPDDERPADQREPPADAAQTATTPRVNPFIVALWIVSALLVVAGAYYILQASENPTARFVASVAVGDIFARTAWTVAPIALQFGLTAMVGLIVWHAITWMRRHPRGTR